MSVLRSRGGDSHWNASHAVLWLGGLLTLMPVLAVAWLAWFEYREVVETERTRDELLARVLVDHATRTAETTAIALSSLAEQLETQPPGSAQIGSSLSQSLIGLPFLRSVAVLNTGGVVLSSTTVTDVGRRIDLARLGSVPEAGRDRLGGFVPGRGLADIAVPNASASPPGVGFVPLLRSLRTRSGENLLLVALINPDTFSSQQDMAVSDDHSGALLASYQGQVLATTRTIDAPPGSALPGHPVFRDYLPAREHGSYLGAGVRPHPQLVSFRVSRSWPLVVMVEHPQAALREGWWHAMRGFVWVGLALLLFLAAMTATAWRSLRVRENTRLLLDQAQAEVAQRERELSVTIKSVQEFIFRTDATGAITFVNARWAAIGGTDPQKAIGTRLHELVQPAQRARVRALFSLDADTGVRTASATVAGGNGLRHFDVAVVPLHHKGRIVGFAGSAADVTDRVVAQQKLQTQLAVSALLLEISPLPLSMLDTAGRYVSVNQAWEDFSGLSRAEVVGRPAVDFLPPDEVALHLEHDRKLLAHGGRVSYEATLSHRDGSRREVVMIKVVVPDDDDRPAGILCVRMDVSEFRAAERATREARDAAEEASRSKSEFIANISHELRTPLQSILGFSELGATRAKEHERLASMFSEINASGQRMLALVNDLLDVSKIESTVGTLHLERTDLRPLLREVVREIDPLLARQQLRLEVKLSEAPLLAKVDPMRFQQVIRNVLANAIKFSPLRGRIDVTGVTTVSNEIHIVVRDQGPGIPPAELERVFAAFVQSSITKDGSGGTGLGLAICRKILQAHGGRIHAENQAEGGSAFHIHLPARGSVETGPVPL